MKSKGHTHRGKGSIQRYTGPGLMPRPVRPWPDQCLSQKGYLVTGNLFLFKYLSEKVPKVMKSDLQASKIQNFPGGHAPTPYIQKVASPTPAIQTGVNDIMHVIFVSSIL